MCTETIRLIRDEELNFFSSILIIIHRPPYLPHQISFHTILPASLSSQFSYPIPSPPLCPSSSPSATSMWLSRVKLLCTSGHWHCTLSIGTVVQCYTALHKWTLTLYSQHWHYAFLSYNDAVLNCAIQVNIGTLTFSLTTGVTHPSLQHCNCCCNHINVST